MKKRLVLIAVIFGGCFTDNDTPKVRAASKINENAGTEIIEHIVEDGFTK